MSDSLANFNRSLLNFTAVDCDIVGQYFAAARIGENVSLTTEYFRQALPAEYRDNFTFADIGSYILPPGENITTWDWKGSQDRTTCNNQICRSAYSEFQGNPDVTGIGVSSSIEREYIHCFLTSP
jgi:hypothetical protein